MAMNLDIHSEGERLRREKERKIERSYKFINIGSCAIMGLAVVLSVMSCVKSAKQTSQVSILKDDLQKQYEVMQQNVESNKAQIEAAKNNASVNPDGSISENTVVEKTMYSAQEKGMRVAELQNLLYANNIVESQKTELRDLTNTVMLWYGEDMDPVKCPISWEFSTWYDSSEYTYDVTWACYTPDHKYLLALQFGVYDGERDAFAVNGTYFTDFGRMYAQNGAIEAGTISENQVGDNVEQMMNDIMENGIVTPTDQNQPTNPEFNNSGNNNTNNAGNTDNAGNAETKKNPADEVREPSVG